MKLEARGVTTVERSRSACFVKDTEADRGGGTGREGDGGRREAPGGGCGLDWQATRQLHGPSAGLSLAAEASALIFSGAWRPNAIYVGLRQQAVSVSAHISYCAEGCGDEGLLSVLIVYSVTADTNQPLSCSNLVPAVARSIRRSVPHPT
jgi:hypothetical protein